MEQACRVVRNNGYVGLITPNTFLRNKYAIAVRELLLRDASIVRLALYDYNVFRGASVDTCVVVFTRDARPDSMGAALVERYQAPDRVVSLGHVPHIIWKQREDLNFDLPAPAASASLLKKIDSRGTRLGEFATAYFGIQTHNRKRFVSPHRIADVGSLCKPALDGVNINRYSLSPPVEWVSVAKDAIKSGGDSRVYEQDRIGVRQIGRRPIATILPRGWYSLNTIYNIFFTHVVHYDLRYVLGLLSSELLGWYWEVRFFDQKRTFPKVKKAPLLSLPIRTIDFSEPTEVAAHDQIVSFVQAMLDLHKDVAAAKAAHMKTALQRQIAATDREIDQLVYNLYGLTDEEIRIVEEATEAKGQ